LNKITTGGKPMVLATIKMLMSQQKRGEALKILRSIVEQCRVQPGCLSSCIYEDLDEENVIMIEEMWQDEEALQRHLRSEEYLNLLLVLEMALRQPEIRFDTISSSTGIETIEKARSHTR
jgi:quinol monooxygenase YgiN